MIKPWWRRRTTTAIDDPCWARVVRRLRWRHGVAPDAADRALAERFLAEHVLQPVQGMALDDARRALLAPLCVRPLRRLDWRMLGDWRDVVVYPGQFRVRRSHADDDGLIREWDEELAGEAWEQGPLVLSWIDVLADLADPQPGFDVVVHEIAHKLDLSDGAMNGTPALPDAATRRRWIEAFQPAFDALCEIVEAGGEPPIDDYAAEGEEEFFAVTSEYHFTAPDLLAAAYPEVAAELAQFYGPAGLGHGWPRREVIAQAITSS